MDEKQRVQLIRKGNDLFNKGEIDKAASVFVTARYIDGITRVGDYYFYEKKLPLKALNYYRMAKCREKVQEIYDRMLFALGKMIGKKENSGVQLPPLKVSPKLKILAEEILRDEREKTGADCPGDEDR